jgi:metallo-beta-lactamase class B
MNKLAAAVIATLGVSATISLAEPRRACAQCDNWNVAQPPFRLYGNSYYVGVRGLSAILITSDTGHILIDGALPESAPNIAASVRELGFRVEDIKLILNTHVHFDHAGGIAQLQRLTGAKVAASASSAHVLQTGEAGPDDPQFGTLPPIGRVARVQVFKDRETVRVGPLAVTPHLTPGHTPGGTSWTWRSCENERCVSMVYADSLNAVSAPSFKFTRAPTNAPVLEDFEKSFIALSSLPCDLLISPHPEQVDLWGRLEKRARGDRDALLDADACKKYVEAARERLKKRVATEREQ